MVNGLALAADQGEQSVNMEELDRRKLGARCLDLASKTGVMERRVAARKRVLKRGLIELRESVLPCKIIDVSDTGACLAAFNAHVLPGFFMLLMPAGKRVFCRSVWRSAERIGVAFRELRVL